MVVHRMDVVTAFLYGVLDEEICMVQPPGYIKDDEEHLVCKLKRVSVWFKAVPTMLEHFLHSIYGVRKF